MSQSQEATGLPRATRRCDTECPVARAWLVGLLVGAVVATAAAAFVLLHRAPLPEEALVMALVSWPGAGDQATGAAFAR